MFSLVNMGVLRSTERHPKIWDKAAYISQYTRWADLAVGIILCVIGSLASYGIIPMAGAGWVIGAGAAQILALVAVRCMPCCRITYHAVRSEGCIGIRNLLAGNPATMSTALPVNANIEVPGVSVT